MADQNMVRVEGWELSFGTESDEPLIRDVDLAERAGMTQPRDIRKLIERHRSELEQNGPIVTRATVTRVEREGRGAVDIAATECWLNEAQSYNLLALSRAPRAAEVRPVMSRVLMLARRGMLPAATTNSGLSIEAARELGKSIVEPLIHHFDQRFNENGRATAQAFEKVNERIVRLEDGLGKRRDISAKTRNMHVFAVRKLGSQCPCCCAEKVLDDAGARIQSAQFDHFFRNQLPNVEHTWLICGRCHADFTYGRVARDQRSSEFGAYQSRRRRIPGGQEGLFN